MTTQPTPPLSPSEDVPAVVHDYSDSTGLRAAVTHPDGDRHPNAVATCVRLVRRGYRIVPFPPVTAPRPS